MNELDGENMLSLRAAKCWVLVAAMATAFSWSTLARAQNNTENAQAKPIEVQNVTAIEAAQLVQDNPEMVILDIRTPVEFKLGQLENAININYYSFSFKKQIAELDRDKTYLIHCHSGVRSGNTMPIMIEAGFTNLFHMDGGYADWKRAKLPVM